MSRKYFEEEVIQQTLDYNYAQHSDAAKFNIAYGIDKNFLFGCGVSIASVLLANPEKALAFHVFTDFFGSEDQQRFEALAKQYATQIVVYLIDCERLKSLPSTKNWTYAHTLDSLLPIIFQIKQIEYFIWMQILHVRGVFRNLLILILLKMRLQLSLLKASWNGGLSARLAWQRLGWFLAILMPVLF